jgi:hypothetical protein
VCAKVATQTNLLTNCGNDLLGLTTPDWLYETTIFCIEEDEVILVTNDFRISCKILFQVISDTGIDHDILTFASLLLFDPKSLLDSLTVIQEMLNAQS